MQALTAILTGDAYAASAEMSGVLGPFPKFEENREAMMRVMRNHRRAAYDADQSEYDTVSHQVSGIDAAVAPEELVSAARESWDRAVQLGDAHGYRNAQATVLAPTGTIGLLMDCDTTGVEPDFALVKFKKLAGGGYFKIANRSIAPALQRLGYNSDQVRSIIAHVVGTMDLQRSPHINAATLMAKGFTAEDIGKIEEVLPSVFELGFAFNQWTVGEETMQRLGFTPEQYNGLGFSMLHELGFSEEDIREANDVRVRPADHRGSARSRGRPPRRLRHRQPQRSVRGAVHPPHGPHQDDGGGPAVHLGGDLEDDQHAQRGDGRRDRGVIPGCRGTWASRRSPCTGTGRRPPSRCRRRPMMPRRAR